MAYVLGALMSGAFTLMFFLKITRNPFILTPIVIIMTIACYFALRFEGEKEDGQD